MMQLSSPPPHRLFSVVVKRYVLYKAFEKAFYDTYVLNMLLSEFQFVSKCSFYLQTFCVSQPVRVTNHILLATSRHTTHLSILFNRRHDCLLHEEPTRQTMYEWRNVVARTCEQCCCGEAISILHSERVSVTLLIQHTMRMLRTILSFMTCLTLPFLSTLSH
jgi:hypothetical protein